MDWRLVGTIVAMGVYFIIVLYLGYVISKLVRKIGREQNDIKKRLGKSRVREQKILRAVRRKGVKQHAA